MINVLYDNLPDSYEGYYLDTSYQTAIQIQDILNDRGLTEYEALEIAIDYLFGDNKPPEDKWMDAMAWWLNGWNHDNDSSDNNSGETVMDFGVDQWRIVSAFWTQYNINLTDSETDLHWWVFIGLLTTLNECAFTRACDIRATEIDSKMDVKEKERIAKLKRIYVIQSEQERKEIAEEKDRINRMLDGV